MTGTPRDSLLASTDWLAARLDDPTLRIVDMRGYVRTVETSPGHQDAAYEGAESEYAEGHIPGARHIPYYFVEQRLHELDPAQPLAVLCGSGQRSTLACALLQRHSFTQLANVVGGMDAWNNAGFEVE